MKPCNPLRKADWSVVPIKLATARSLVTRYHYAKGGANTATATHGLIENKTQRICGATWWLPPTRTAAAAIWPDPEEVLSLSRLVVAPGCPTNAASFLLMGSVALLDDRWRCLVTWADTAQGHSGAIYRAANWEYLGLSQATDAWTVNGRMTARKAGGKTRTHDEMRALGAEFLGYHAKHRFRLVRRRPSKQPAFVLPLEQAS